jgi:hypothetical protein
VDGFRIRIDFDSVESYNRLMGNVKNMRVWMIFSLCILATASGQAATVIYTFENVVLADGEQITGTFYWTYSDGDFEDGNGVFTALEIPWRPGGTAPPLEQEGMVLTIENNQIEISLDGNFHDYGLDISLKFEQSLSPSQSSLIDLNASLYDCCGNGFKKQPFQSGSVSPIPQPANLYHFAILASGWGTTYSFSDLIDLANAWLTSEWL